MLIPSISACLVTVAPLVTCVVYNACYWNVGVILLELYEHIHNRVRAVGIIGYGDQVSVFYDKGSRDIVTSASAG